MPFQELLDNYLAVFLAAIIGFILVATALIGTRILAPFSDSPQKRTSYECGMAPIGRTRTQLNVRYYLFAILFLIFDVEAVFIFPWATRLELYDVFGLIEMGVFIVILSLGILYAWRKGMLRWV